MSAYDKVQNGELPTRTDPTDGTVIYEGFPLPGAAPDEPSWAIRKRALVSGVWITSWAGGNRVKKHLWDDRDTDLDYAEIIEIEK